VIANGKSGKFVGVLLILATPVWNVTAGKAPLSGTISIAINDSVVVADKPAAFANTIDAKGTYRGHEVHFFAVYNNGILGIFGAGWETTVLVDNELAARFTL